MTEHQHVPDGPYGHAGGLEYPCGAQVAFAASFRRPGNMP